MARRSQVPTLLSWTAAAGDLLLGARCAGCGRPWWGACPDCRQRCLGRAPRPTRPDPSPPGFPPTVTAGPYDEVLRGLITAHKEEQALQLTRLLGRLLAGSVAALSGVAGLGRADPLALVPVPSAAAALRRRGFDATAALARAAARSLREPYPQIRVVHALAQRRGRRDQSELSAAERQANLRGGLRLRGAGRALGGGAYAIVVDDLVTTGASLTEAAQVLRLGGVAVIGAATVAATERRAKNRVGPVVIGERED